MVGEQKAFGLLNDNPLPTPFKTHFVIAKWGIDLGRLKTDHHPSNRIRFRIF